MQKLSEKDNIIVIIMYHYLRLSKILTTHPQKGVLKLGSTLNVIDQKLCESTYVTTVGKPTRQQLCGHHLLTRLKCDL